MWLKPSAAYGRTPWMFPAAWRNRPEKKTTRRWRLSSRRQRAQVNEDRTAPIKDSPGGRESATFPSMSVAAASTVPDARGHFGPYGGRYVPETLMHPLKELEEEYFRSQQDPEFQRELQYYLREFCGRPTPLYFAERLTRELGGAKIYLKREDLLHTGAHKINNAMGQILLAKRMGKTRIIAETGAGQHGVATATVSAMFGLKCVIYMGEVDCQRQ